ncbi:hypothetical protein [Hymenobacter amundsenii]|uniref:hypothetical protein n=1 Tax=Hymenobacter amundsenii TaxID=2006685 RepID=UPI0013FDB8BB|nr:hypothetical protein [Hymenobacter amundsenii]
MVPDTRRRKHLLRLIIDTLICRANSGCQRPLLHREFSAFPLVYYFFQLAG